MYPEVRRLLPDLDEDILESYEEHHVADVLCLELSTMDADEEHFAAKVKVLIENVSHHIDEEEQDCSRRSAKTSDVTSCRRSARGCRRCARARRRSRPSRRP